MSSNIDFNSMTPNKYYRVYPNTSDDEIVISGISGKFPKANNMQELQYNLYNKVDMTSETPIDWKLHHPELPNRHGLMSSNKFDATFFGIHYKQAHAIDPQGRLLIERAFEAVLDAGINPQTLRNTKIGVYIGSCTSEAEGVNLFHNRPEYGISLTGCSRNMLSNRISFCLGLTGPSMSVDTGCSSSLFALDLAFSAIRNGECDGAIVGGTNLCHLPVMSSHFTRLGVLSPDGNCRPFDEDASGYARSSAIITIFIQKIKDAKRCYAKLLYSKTNCDGHKIEGITFPSMKLQQQLLTEFYADISMDPCTVNYMEAHGTGTVIGDVIECAALESVFCKNQTKPLLIGSIKSNMGHSETSAGVVSIAKVILAYESGIIAPNLYFKKVRPDVPSLVNGNLKVCSEPTKLDGPFIGINGFGYGGANCHVLLHQHLKEKLNDGLPIDDTPRLVNWSGRTNEAIDIILNEIESRPLDAEYIGLLHNIQSQEIPGFIFRGYGLFAKRDNKSSICLDKCIKHYSDVKLPVVWVFSGMGCQWNTMGTSLLKIPICEKSLLKSHEILKPLGLNLLNILTSSDPNLFDNILNSFVGIAACQIALVDTLKYLDIKFDYLIGHSFGELGCAYADECFTAEEVLLAAHSRGMATLETKLDRGLMAAVALGYKEIVKIIPNTIEVACHNSSTSVTLSGPEHDIKEYVAHLKENGIFATIVQSSNIAYHSKYIADMAPNLMKRLTELIPKPKKRSAKWLSTSVPVDDWKKEEHQYCSAQYLTYNLLNPVLFEETTALLPQEHISIEIAPHGLLQSILRKAMPNSITIPLTDRKSENNLEFFFSALGKLFINGISFPIDKMYPAIDFPVSRGTPMISPHIKWDHTMDWQEIEHTTASSIKCERKTVVNISLPELEYLAGHVIDGRCVYPATAYIYFVWETFAFMKKNLPTKMSVEFEDIKFLRATSLTKEQPVQLTVTIQYVNGLFEISEGSASIVTGRIREITDKYEFVTLPPKNTSNTIILSNDDFYKELRLRGYHYNGAFKSITEANADATYGKLKWNSNWVSFMDCVLQMNIISMDSRFLLLPTGIQKIRINPLYHAEIVAAMDPARCELDINVCHEFGTIICGGIEITKIKFTAINRRKATGIPILEYYKFVSHIPTETMTIVNAARVCIQLAVENNNLLNIKCIEFDDPLNDKNIPIIQYFEEAVDGLPLVYADLLYLTSKENVQLGNNIKIENIKLTENTNSTFIIINESAVATEKLTSDFSKYLMQKGYLLLRAKSNIDKNSLCIPEGFQLNAIIPTDNDENIIMYQKMDKDSKLSKNHPPTIIRVSSNDEQYNWLNQLQMAVKKRESIILLAENDSVSGIIGLVNCIRKEPDANSVICVFIDDPNAPAFDYENLFYKTQLNLGFAFNVYQNGKWGSYRHLLLRDYSEEFSFDGHYYATTLRPADLSSFTWLRGPLNIKETANIVQIHYSSINFHDIMIATGRITDDALNPRRTAGECVLGMEYSGIDSDGKRVMGMVDGGGMATYLVPSNYLTWRIPDNWSLTEAATVPVVYLTIYIAFFGKCTIQRGQSILIHAGSGGVGLAAIRVALAYGLEVFTTVSTIEKKEFILKEYPELKECNIGNSRDCSFEQMIYMRTNGKGVDYVLNSLADDKLQASIRCVGGGGAFLEIGRYDLEKDTKIGLGHFLNDISFISVHADKFIKNETETKRNFMIQLIQRDIKNGIIKPLPSTVFQINEIEKAFRHMSTGYHIGKVLIKIRDDPMDSKPFASINVYPMVYCDPNLVFIIVGGLGGFGLELADWLMLRGARKIILSSSRGLTTAFQEYRISVWKSYGCEINISTADITQRNGCKQLLEESLRLGPVGGIFNLAVCLKDSVLENQTKEKFYACVAPKAIATNYLDDLSRTLCPQLKYFVVFSSLSCGRGNAGQSNYGLANSIMERIVEQRANCNLPAKAIQWAGIGEVGVIANLTKNNVDAEFCGTLPQRISSCLTELDKLLCSHQPIVASMVIAPKGAVDKKNVFEYILNFAGIQDIKLISLNSPLSKFGLDSLAIVELRQTLERDFEINLNVNELRAITIGEIKALTTHSNDIIKQPKTITSAVDDINAFNLWIRNVGDEYMCKHNMLRLPSLDQSLINCKSCILIFPGIEGTAGTIWFNVAKNITLPTHLCQYMNVTEQNSINEIIDSMKSTLINTFTNVESFFLIGYSFGTLLTMEFAKILENIGMKGRIVLIDGAPRIFKTIAERLDDTDEKNYEIKIFTHIMDHFFPDVLIEHIENNTHNCSTILDKINKVINLYDNKNKYSNEFIKLFISGVIKRLKLFGTINENNITKINSPITLVRPTIQSVHVMEDDFGLSNHTNGPVNIKIIDGDHSSILENKELIDIINEDIEKML